MKIESTRTARWAIGLGVSVAALAVAAPTVATVPGGGGDRSREPTRVTITVSGEEYELPDFVTLNGTDGTCPHSNDVPSAQAPCWTWTAKHLGRGVAILGVDAGEYTLTLIGCHGDTLFGDGGPPEVIPDPTPPHAIGHVNRFPQEMTFTGTGRFEGVTGTMTGAGFSRVVAVDPDTGIVHKKVGIDLTGKLTID